MFIAQLNDQTDDIIAATESLNSLVGQFAAKDQTVDKALTTIPQALAVLTDSRTKLAERDRRAGQVQRDRDRRRSTRPKKRWSSNLRNIAPVLQSLANAGPALTRALDFLSTFPWVKRPSPTGSAATSPTSPLVIDLTLSRIDSSLFTGTRWEGDLTELEMQWGRTIGQMPSPYTAGNPLIAPYHWGAY